MEIITHPKEMQKISEKRRNKGEIISFVPTMGYFHAGHLNLMKEGRESGDFLVVSLFVNPIQFGPNEDLDQYPRDFDNDKRLSEEVGVDVIFAPSQDSMYSDNSQTRVVVENLTKNLCGLKRPGHFQGVTTIVAKLFNIVKPHYAIFGQKDYQQLIVIKRMVEDVNFDLKIITVPTVREADGLAMSSRNSYLNSEEREAATCIYRAIKEAEDLFHSGEKVCSKIINRMKEIIQKNGLNKIEYVQICDADTLKNLDIIDRPAVAALAVRAGKTRLIDNCLLNN
ncbi:MAG: pantoate--beta-alanine ligase [Thermodesulfobacteriota bacterium]|nr:pantoate--beta-alanine ligase [Thermodesulfobacteriota bacterium]